MDGDCFLVVISDFLLQLEAVKLWEGTFFSYIRLGRSSRGVRLEVVGVEKLRGEKAVGRRVNTHI